MWRHAGRVRHAEARSLGGGMSRSRQTPTVPPQHDTSPPQEVDVTADRGRFLTALFRNYETELIAKLRRVYGNGPPDPEDIAQSAFSQMASMRVHDHIEDPKAFLFKIALNIGRRATGRIAATRKLISQELKNVAPQLEEITPERLYESKERLAAMNQAIERLTPKQRDILIRSRMKGETYAEISAATGWSLAAISRQLNAALAQLAAVCDGVDNSGDTPDDT